MASDPSQPLLPPNGSLHGLRIGSRGASDIEIEVSRHHDGAALVWIKGAGTFVIPGLRDALDAEEVDR